MRRRNYVAVLLRHCRSRQSTFLAKFLVSVLSPLGSLVQYLISLCSPIAHPQVSAAVAQPQIDEQDDEQEDEFAPDDLHSYSEQSSSQSQLKMSEERSVLDHTLGSHVEYIDSGHRPPQEPQQEPLEHHGSAADSTLNDLTVEDENCFVNHDHSRTYAASSAIPSGPAAAFAASPATATAGAVQLGVPSNTAPTSASPPQHVRSMIDSHPQTQLPMHPQKPSPPRAVTSPRELRALPSEVSNSTSKARFVSRRRRCFLSSSRGFTSRK